MATLLRPSLAAATASTRRHLTRHLAPQVRTFFPLPPQQQTLSAHEKLPYAAPKLYDIIADIDRYRTFLPYCTHSQVTHWSTATSSERRWPMQADLTAGWGGLSETYTSRVRCEPGRGVVEAVSGDAVARELGGVGGGGGAGLFRSLVTRWTVTPLSRDGGDWSKVDLSIKFEFANPLYTAVSSAVADKIAPKMIEAFVAEAKRVLREPKR